MEDLFNSTNSNSNESSSTSSNLLIGSSNYYESALRKIAHIFKAKPLDNLKQLEELWECVNVPPPQPKAPSDNESPFNGKRDSSKIVDSSSTSQQAVKKIKTSPTPLPVNSQQMKPPAVSHLTVDITVNAPVAALFSASNKLSNLPEKINLDDINNVVDMLEITCTSCKYVKFFYKVYSFHFEKFQIKLKTSVFLAEIEVDKKKRDFFEAIFNLFESWFIV
jgi:hypothetical protein